MTNIVLKAQVISNSGHEDMIVRPISSIIAIIVA